jgi:hypothetical protein
MSADAIVAVTHEIDVMRWRKVVQGKELATHK